MSDDITNTIEQLAADGIASASFSSGSSSQSVKSISELIEADRYLKGERAKDYNHGGIMFRQIQPPGAVQ
jgi:hypothetical protein